MFESVTPLPPDPLLGIIVAYNQDTNPNKVDLGVGVYRDNSGITPIFPSVKKAEAQYLADQTTKAYIGPAGSAEYNQLISQLIFGENHQVLTNKRTAIAETPGGCGALRVGAEFIKRIRPEANIWLSDPTWPNHAPLLGDAGLQLKTYPYFDFKTRAVDFEAMVACLEKVPASDVVLFHACCHNPSGADLSEAQWDKLAQIAKQQGFTVFIDSAYQGFGQGLNEDAYGVRLMADTLPELIVASSCSKNFGLYRERTGTLCIVAERAELAAGVQTHINKIVRGIYSMPPAHGAGIVETVLKDADLTKQWHQELATVRTRIKSLRKALADALQIKCGNDHFRFIEKQVGMFSFLDLNPEQVKHIREEFSIYMAGDSRANIAGLKNENVKYVAEAIKAVIG